MTCYYEHSHSALASIIDTPIQRIRMNMITLLDIFIKHCGFEGDQIYYYDIHNSLLGSVLQRKRGNPIMLAILFMYIVERVCPEVRIRDG